MIFPSPYYKYIGKPVCRYLEAGRSRALELVAQSIYHDFCDAQDRLICVGDASPIVGACPGHPGVSHGGKITVDVDYYTLLDSNNTQRWTSDLKPVVIWKEPGEVLLNNGFDWHRNFIFAARMEQIMPGSWYRTNDVLAKTMRTGALDLYGPIANQFLNRLAVTAGTKYNHHIHAHLDLGEMDTCFRINDFFRR